MKRLVFKYYIDFLYIMVWEWLLKLRELLELIKQGKNVLSWFKGKDYGLALEITHFNFKEHPEKKNEYFINAEMILRNTGNEKRGIKKVEIWYQLKNTDTGKDSRFFPVKEDFYILPQEKEYLRRSCPLEFKNIPLELLFEVFVIDYQDNAYNSLVKIQPRKLKNNQYFSGFSVMQKLKPTKIDDFYKAIF